jgi:hypothetical protein
MIIVSAQWVASGSAINIVLDTGRSLSAPDDMDNVHRQAIQAWVDLGNTISPADPEVSQTADEIYDAVIQNQAVLKAVVTAINKGTFVPGANETNADLKAIIKAEM